MKASVSTAESVTAEAPAIEREIVAVTACWTVPRSAAAGEFAGSGGGVLGAELSTTSDTSDAAMTLPDVLASTASVSVLMNPAALGTTAWLGSIATPAIVELSPTKARVLVSMPLYVTAAPMPDEPLKEKSPAMV